MKARFPIVVATLVVMAAPVFANTPSSDPFGTPSNARTAQPAPGQYSGDAYGDALISPFGDHQNPGGDLRARNGRSRNNLVPPRMDASGAPDPRI